MGERIPLDLKMTIFTATPSVFCEAALHCGRGALVLHYMKEDLTL